MHFEKKILSLITILLMFLVVFGCGEDEIEDADVQTQIATAVLKATLPYGEELLATFATSGDSINYRSDMLIQDLSLLPQLNDGFVYKTWIYSESLERQYQACDEDGFNAGMEVSYMNSDNLNLSHRYNIYTISMDTVDASSELDSILLFEGRIAEDIFEPVNEIMLDYVQEMRVNADQAIIWAETMMGSLDEIGAIQDAADEINDYLMDIDGAVRKVAEVDTTVLQLPHISMTPVENSALELETLCYEVYQNIADAAEIAQNIQAATDLAAAVDLAGQLNTLTQTIASIGGLIPDVHVKFQRLLRFYPSFYESEPTAQVSIHGREIKVTVSQLNRLPDGWVYKIWLKKGEQYKPVTTFNTNSVGTAISFAKLDDFPGDYNEIYVTIELYEDEVPTGIEVLKGTIVKE